MYHICIFFKNQQNSGFLLCLIPSSQQAMYCNRQMFPSFPQIPTPTLKKKKRPQCREGIDGPKVNGIGKTFCEQMKKREKNRKEKQWLSSQMFTHEKKERCLIEYSQFWQPSSSSSNRCRSSPAPSSWIETDKPEKACGSCSPGMDFCQPGGVRCGLALFIFTFRKITFEMGPQLSPAPGSWMGSQHLWHHVESLRDIQV